MSRTHKHHLRHAGIYVLARGGPGLIAFLAIPIFSRLLDPAEYGRYAVVVAIVATANAAVFQWLRLSMVRFLPGANESHVRLKSTLITTCLLLLALLGVLAGIATLVPQAAGWRTAIFCAWGLTSAQVLFDLSCEYSRAVMKPWRYMLTQMTRTILWLLIGGGLVWLGWGWYGPVAALAIAMLAACALFGASDWRDARPAIDRELLARMFRYGMPISITVLLGVIVVTCDRLMLVAWHGEAAAGGYAVAVDFTLQTITLLMIAVNMAVFPAAVSAWTNEGADAAMEHMSSNASLLMGVGVPAVVGAVILTPGIAHCLLGADFRAAAVPLIPLVAAASLVGGLKAYHFDAAFQFAHKTTQQVWIALVVAALNVTLNVFLIPRFGPIGAATSMLIAYTVMILLAAYVGRRLVALPFPASSVWRIALAAAVMAVLLIPTRSYIKPAALVSEVAVGAAAYAMVLIATNFLGIREMLFRRAAASRVAVDATSPTLLKQVPEM